MITIAHPEPMAQVRGIPEKIPGGGGGGGKSTGDILFYGWLVRRDFKLYESLVSNQIKLHGWLVIRCVEGEERILSAKKERSFIKSSQNKALSLANRGNSHFCLHAIVKPRMFPSNIGKKLPNSGFCSGHYFTWETCIFRRIISRKQRYRVVRSLVKANTCKNLYQ